MNPVLFFKQLQAWHRTYLNLISIMLLFLTRFVLIYHFSSNYFSQIRHINGLTKLTDGRPASKLHCDPESTGSVPKSCTITRIAPQPGKTLHIHLKNEEKYRKMNSLSLPYDLLRKGMEVSPHLGRPTTYYVMLLFSFC